MIEARELRIGNWLIGKHSKNPYQVSGYELYQATELNSGWIFVPIPLTPEILEKAGFKNGEREDLWIQFHSDMQCWMIDPESGKGVPLDHIKYLHQLQNLIFALTQTELTIDL